MVSAEYLAGFIDGEGYLALGRIPRGRQSPEYPLRAVVYNSSLQILEEIQREWGGTLSDSGSRNPRWKPGLALIWTNAAAASILTKVAPFLRVKSRQAAEMLAFHRHIREYRRTRDERGRILPLPQSELEFREACHKRLKEMNARGPLSGTSPGQEAVLDRTGVGDSDLSLEYLAGLVDGEGSLMITRWKGNGSHPHYRPRISITNTNRTVLEAVRRIHGGILADQPAQKAAWKHSYQLIWTNGMVEGLLAELMPHLRLKREQAALILEFMRHQRNTPRSRCGPNRRFFAPLPAAVLAFREELYQRMKHLNAKGLPLTPART